uniref:Uncharacterized protein n=1 Tax=Cannabis sativa TaxID=3483 RepID=A0A803P1E5_CANSA
MNWPIPTPYEINFLCDLKRCLTHKEKGFYHFHHFSVCIDNINKNNYGLYHKEHFYTPNIPSRHVTFQKVGPFKRSVSLIDMKRRADAMLTDINLWEQDRKMLFTDENFCHVGLIATCQQVHVDYLFASNSWTMSLEDEESGQSVTIIGFKVMLVDIRVGSGDKAKTKPSGHNEACVPEGVYESVVRDSCKKKEKVIDIEERPSTSPMVISWGEVDLAELSSHKSELVTYLRAQDNMLLASGEAFVTSKAKNGQFRRLEDQVAILEAKVVEDVTFYEGYCFDAI